MGFLEIILVLVGLIGGLSTIWLSRLHRRLDMLDERLRRTITRETAVAIIKDKLEPVEVQTREIKEDIQHLGTKLDKIIDKLLSS